jgi:hypothetical protein
MRPRPALHLPNNRDAPRVKEAKEIVSEAIGELDHALVPFALRMAEARNAWVNRRKHKP